MEAVCRTLTIALALSGASLPSEFRIFAAGENRSTKGVVVFDDAAAEQVMQAYREHGIEVMLDLEHLSLDTEGRHFNPDAQGWARLEVRGGELWAVDVRWTPEGAERLKAGKQRYISPAFFVDDDNRVVSLTNIAITALPASHGLSPLIAASQRQPAKGSTKAKRFAMADGEGGDVAGVDIKGLADFLGISEDPASNPAGFIQSVLAKLDEVRAKLSGEAPAEAPPPAEVSEAMAIRRVALALTGHKTASQAIDTLTAWKALVKEIEVEAAKVERDRRALELTERSAIYAELVKLGAETPATSGLSEGKPAKHLEAMSLVELRARRDSFKALRGATGAGPAPRPAQAAAYQLSAREQKFCADKKIDPAVYAAQRAAMKARSAAPLGADEAG